MRNLKIIFVALSLLAFAACKSQKKDSSDAKKGSEASGEIYSAAKVLLVTESIQGVKSATTEINGSLFEVDAKNWGLILPAKAFFRPSPKQNLNYVPFVKSVSLQVFGSSSVDPILDAKDLSFDIKGALSSSIKVHGIGFSLDITNSSKLEAFEKVLGSALQKTIERYFQKASLVHNGAEFRNEYTSFVMLSIPKASQPSSARYFFPIPIGAENRPLDNEIAESLANGGSLTVEKFGAKKLSYNVKALTSKSSLKTITAGNQELQQQIWEVTSEDHNFNDDYGASLVWRKSADEDPVYLGFIVKSETNGSGQNALVVSPSHDHYAALIKLTR